MNKSRVLFLSIIIIGFVSLFYGRESDQSRFQSFRANVERKVEAPVQDKVTEKSKTLTTKVVPAKVERSPAQRNDYSEENLLARERAEKFLALQRARAASKQRKQKTFDFLNERGEGFRLMPELQAIPMALGEIRDAQVVSGHYIVAGAPSDQTHHVVKTERGTYAVFTGVIKVIHEKGDDPYRIANDFGGEVSEVYEHINSVFIKYHDYSEALTAHNNLKGAKGIKSAQLEVLEHGRQPR